MQSKKLPLVLIVVGLFFLGRNLGWFSTDVLRNWWPVVLVAVGCALLFKERKSAQ